MIDMTPNVVLVVVIAVLFAAGVYLVLERSLSRVLLGTLLLGNGANLLFMVAGGRAGGAPIIGTTALDEMTDPLPQAMVLTAIVISLGMVGFVLSMAYRSWQLNGHDEVQDDLEDRRVARKAAANAPAYVDTDTEDSEQTLDDEAAEQRDETVHDEYEASVAADPAQLDVRDADAAPGPTASDGAAPEPDPEPEDADDDAVPAASAAPAGPEGRAAPAEHGGTTDETGTEEER